MKSRRLETVPGCPSAKAAASLDHVIADMLFRCELIAALPSDLLFVLYGQVRRRSLYAGYRIGAASGLWIIVSGEVEAAGGGVSCTLGPGEFFADVLDDHGMVGLSASSDAELLWIPAIHVERLSAECSAFRRVLFSGTFRSATVALGLMNPPGCSAAIN